MCLTIEHENEVIWGRQQTVAPTVRPLTDVLANDYSRIHHTKDNVTIERLIKLATDYVFEHTDRQLILATYLLSRRCFPRSRLVPMVIPIYPVSSVTQIQYIDADGVLQTWASDKYKLNKRTEPGAVEPVSGETYPTTRNESEAVQVTAVCGHGAAETDVPELHKQPIYQLVSYWYANRGSIPAPAIDGLFAPTIDALIAASDSGQFVG